MRTITCLLLGVALSLAGCRKPKPSLEYSEAKGAHSTVVARLGDDAYSDPEMDRIGALLDKVPASSLDAAAAAELKGLIASERKRIADEAAAHAKLMNSVNAPPPDWPSSSPPPRVEEPGQLPAAVPDAGAAAGDPQPGMTVDEMRKATQDCFTSAGTLKLKRGDQQADGEMYERFDSGNCRFRYPTYAGRILVFQDGKMMGTYDKSQLQTGLKPGGVVGGAGGAGGTAGGPGTTAPGPGTQPPPPNPPQPDVTPPPPQNELPKPPTNPGENTGPAQQY